MKLSPQSQIRKSPCGVFIRLYSTVPGHTPTKWRASAEDANGGELSDSDPCPVIALKRLASELRRLRWRSASALAVSWAGEIAHA
jgi:hypothetical protein